MIPMEVTLENLKKLSPEKYTIVATWIADNMTETDASEKEVLESADQFFDRYADAFEALAK